jgi:cytosine/adenosine deaminase-related metal-dependent hydrolase
VTADRWLDAYIFTAGRAAIDSVWVGGRPVVSGGRHRNRDAIGNAYKAALARLIR